MRIRVLSPAIEEIADAAQWYDDQRAGLGSEFWRAVDDTLAMIERNPHRFGKSEFATDDMDLRFAIVRRFKYVVHFAIAVDEVQIAAVAHPARRPGYWLQRCRG